MLRYCFLSTVYVKIEPERSESMIYIVTAIYAEAHPFITRFSLKKDISHTRFQVFQNLEGDLCLIISGTGAVPAATALSSICTEYGVKQGDFLLNAGVCAGIQSRNIHKTENTCQAGAIFLCNKIKDHTTGKTFYPDILYRHDFPEAQIVTGARPYINISQHNVNYGTVNNDADFYLYDMEAAAIYQAGSYYFSPHQMSFLKIISDDGNTEDVTPLLIEELIDRNMDCIAAYLANLQEISRQSQQEEILPETTQKDLEKLCLDMHCSKVMSESVRQHIRYCVLSGIDYISVLEEMYRNGKLPCKDKREGKQCFEELKEQLL